MSEYQYIAFRAVDRPLTDRELTFAKKQSTRAEITRWSFENEYHHSDFRGDTHGLLRRGYDVHLHYANFGVRRIAVRLPAGLPFPKQVWSRYLGVGQLSWKKDAKGKGGILSLAPFHDAESIGEIWGPGEYVDDVVAVRNGLAAGDLRALYLLWLCGALDDEVEPEVVEPPVPGGLAECVKPWAAFLDFFGLDPLILLAASEGAPAAAAQQNREQRFESWVGSLSDGEQQRLLLRFLVEDAASVKAEAIAGIRESGATPDWPTATLGRTFEELLDRTETRRSEFEAKEEKKREVKARREAAKRERERQLRMKKMVKEPTEWLREADKLVAARGTDNYKAAAEVLADLREAIGGEEGDRITRKHAAHLAKKHPTLSHLKSSLRKRGLWG